MSNGFINEEAVRQLILDTVKKGGITINIPFEKIKSFAEEAIKVPAEEVLAKASKLISVTQEVRIVQPDGEVMKKQGLFHKDFATVFNLTTARNPSNNYPVGCWLWGGAGAGKTHLAEQIAECLKQPFYPIYGGPTLTETKLLGYRNAGSGTYVKGLCYDWYRGGGLLAVDEADLGEALVALNSLFANRVYRFPDGELIERHPDTYFIALANTNGTGARQGFKRQVQDMAALDRFNFWKFEYDAKLTKALSGDYPEFADYVEKVYQWVKGQAKETNLHVTPRATMRGVALLSTTDMSGPAVAEAAIFGLFPEDTKQACLKACGQFTRPDKPVKEKLVNVLNKQAKKKANYNPATDQSNDISEVISGIGG